MNIFLMSYLLLKAIRIIISELDDWGSNCWSSTVVFKNKETIIANSMMQLQYCVPMVFVNSRSNHFINIKITD